MEQVFVRNSTLVKTTGIKVSDNILTEVASNEIYDQIVDDRAKLRALNVLPDVLITGPKGYAKLLKAPEFQRAVQRADETVYDGYVGSIAGLKSIRIRNIRRISN